MATHQRADLAAAGHELQRSVDRVSHRVPGVLRRSAKHRKLSETSEGGAGPTRKKLRLLGAII